MALRLRELVFNTLSFFCKLFLHLISICFLLIFRCTIGPQRRASQERAVLVEEIGVEMASGPLALESRARVDQDLM
jgi:hypothetical protein